MRLRTLTAATAVAAMAVTGLAFHETPENEIAANASRVDGTVSFEGYANLPMAEAATIKGSKTAFADGDVAAATGTDLTGATITELEDGSGLMFTWHVSSMPAEGVPEGVRYNWTFEVDGDQYQMQVKRSNLASVTTAEAPVNHALEAAEGDWWYQLRGACEANYMVEQNPVSGCYHLGFFDGSVDTSTGTISMIFPYQAEDGIGRKVAESFRPGKELVAAESAAMSITASHQAVVSNATTSQFINGWGSYHIGTTISVGLGDAAGAFAYDRLDTDGSGAFAGSVDGEGTHLWVKACRGYDKGSIDPCIERSFVIS